MKEELFKILRGIVGVGVPIELTVPEEPNFGHFSTNVAMRLAKSAGKRPIELAEEIVIAFQKEVPEGFIEKVEAASPGFVNFWMSKEVVQKEFKKAAANEGFGASDTMTGKKVIVEFTDLNPFKIFHIGHLMPNAIGEAIACLYEAAGAKSIRVNYQGDVGLHVAKTIWGMMSLPRNGEESLSMPSASDDIRVKMAFLGAAYVLGSKAHESDAEAKEVIVGINKAIYEKSSQEINELYDIGRRWSLEYFEMMYARLGTKFDHYFFESEIQQAGVALVLSNMDVFAESEGAIIFPGEQYGLHTRVFISSKGLPTYEAKELGLNQKKFEMYAPDLSIIVTGNEITEYFKVLKKAMELVLGKVAGLTQHVAHGMLRLPSGKMSSRTGDIITAESMIDQAKERILEKMRDNPDLIGQEKDAVAEAIAIGAVKYSILKQNPGQDIIFDFEKSLSFEGDSGPYVQYSYARLRSILRKAEDAASVSAFEASTLDSEVELALIRKIFEFPDVVAHARERYAPSAVVAYVYKLASHANKFYETTPILKDENASRKQARLALVAVAARTIKSGLELLGIQAPEKI